VAAALTPLPSAHRAVRKRPLFHVWRSNTGLVSVLTLGCLQLWSDSFRHRASSFSHICRVKLKLKLRPTVSRPVCLGVGLPSGAHGQIFVFCLTIADFLIRSALSDGRMGLQFTRTIASGPCQSSHSRVQVPQNSQPYLTVSYETGARGSVVVKALCYKPEGRGFDSR
jgi:hypothetical protein